ncbi:MAG: hypothetical protein LBH01_01190 [Verrucomicrobiales bacterium]|jgi:hypothetical protein|nr:hypothetical protein [Verrucomicrobiales bacterium]
MAFGQLPTEEEFRSLQGSQTHWIDEMMEKDIKDGAINGKGNLQVKAFFEDSKLGLETWYLKPLFLPGNDARWIGIFHDSSSNVDRIYCNYKVPGYEVLICETNSLITIQLDGNVIPAIPDKQFTKILFQSLLKGFKDVKLRLDKQGNGTVDLHQESRMPKWVNTISWNYFPNRIRVYFLKIPEDYAPASDPSFYIKKNQNWFTPTTAVN